MNKSNIETLYKEFVISKDSKVFGKFYELIFDDLYHYAKAILIDEELVRDAISDVITSVWINKDKLNLDTNIKNYLIVAVRNKCRDVLKSKEYKGKLPPQERNRLIEQLNHQEDDPFDVLVYKDLLKKLKMAISDMKGLKREVFILIKLKGLTYKRVAELKGISEKTVEKYMRENLKVYDSYNLPQLRKKKGNNKGGSLSIILVWSLLSECILFFLSFFSKKRRVTFP